MRSQSKLLMESQLFNNSTTTSPQQPVLDCEAAHPTSQQSQLQTASTQSKRPPNQHPTNAQH